jgi:hypothetical protein
MVDRQSWPTLKLTGARHKAVLGLRALLHHAGEGERDEGNLTGEEIQRHCNGLRLGDDGVSSGALVLGDSVMEARRRVVEATNGRRVK